MLCPDALPRRVAHRTEVTQVPAKEVELKPCRPHEDAREPAGPLTET